MVLSFFLFCLLFLDFSWYLRGLGMQILSCWWLQACL